MLPPYRRVGLRGQTKTPQDDIVEHLTGVLGRYGRVLMVTADEHGYVNAELEPPGTPDECVAALKATVDTYWDEAPEGPSWQHTAGGPTFLHPDMDWVTLSGDEAATLPRFAKGDEVRIASITTSMNYEHLLGRTATVTSSCYSHVKGQWLYVVYPSGERGPHQFAEAELTTPPAAPPTR
jgi:hypothetical protein